MEMATIEGIVIVIRVVGDHEADLDLTFESISKINNNVTFFLGNLIKLYEILIFVV